MKACELSHWKDVRNLSRLAAACAEMGNFEDAIKWQKKAIELATKEQRAVFEERIAFYRGGKPYRETTVGQEP